MINKVQDALDVLSALPVPVQSANGMGRIFELYVMTGIAEALQNIGWTIRLLGSDGRQLAPGEPFVQRGGKTLSKTLYSFDHDEIQCKDRKAVSLFRPLRLRVDQTFCRLEESLRYSVI